MSVDARCRIYGGLWVFAAALLAGRALVFYGVGEGVDVVLRGQAATVALAAAVAVGVLKGATVMRRAAWRARARIGAAGPRAGIGSVFPWSVMALLVGMMALGWVIRRAPYPDAWRAWLVGIVYPAVALALAIGAVPLLRAGPAGLRSRTSR